jgi:hypothetical protein
VRQAGAIHSLLGMSRRAVLVGHLENHALFRHLLRQISEQVDGYDG